MREFYRFLQPKFFMPLIRNYYDNQLALVLKDEKKKYDINEPNNFIIERLMSQNYINSIGIALQVTGIAYLGGIVWLYCVTHYLKNDGQENFMSHYELNQIPLLQQHIISAYFSFTTLSSTGLGDYRPFSNNERLFASLFMLFGTALYSFIQIQFGKTLENL